MLPFALLLLVIVGGAVANVVDRRRDVRPRTGGKPPHPFQQLAEREDDR
jgi:hypothetical protein